MKIKNIIFDFDGTLVDTAPVIITTMKATFLELGLPERSEQECRSTIGLRLEDIPAKLFPGQADISKEYASTYRRIFTEKNLQGAAKPFDGVMATLDRLSDLGFRMAVASSRSRKSLIEYVSGLGMNERFMMVIGGDDVAHGKPSPDPVNVICGTLKWNVAETLVVGDAEYDILMGKAAGTLTCGVNYGNGTPNELIDAGADMLVDRFDELPEAIGSLSGLHASASAI